MRNVYDIKILWLRRVILALTTPFMFVFIFIAWAMDEVTGIDWQRLLIYSSDTWGEVKVCWTQEHK